MSWFSGSGEMVVRCAAQRLVTKDASLRRPKTFQRV